MLSDNRRAKLDLIVSQAEANGETPETIQLIVEDYKAKYSGEKKSPINLREAWGALNPLANQALSTAKEVIGSKGRSLPAGLLGAADSVSFGLIPLQERVSNYIKDKVTSSTGLEAQKSNFAQAQADYPETYSGGQMLGSIGNPVNIATADQPVLNILGNVLQGQTNLPLDAPLIDRLKMGGIDLLSSVGGRYVANKFIKPQITGYKPNVRGEVINGLEDIKLTTQQEIPLAYDSLTTSRGSDIAGQTARGTPFVRGGFARTGQEGIEKTYSALDQMQPGKGRVPVVGSAGAMEYQLPKLRDAEKTVSAIDNAITKYDSDTSAAVGPLYDSVSKDLGKIPFPTNIVNKALELKGQISTLLPNLDEGPAKKVLSDLLENSKTKISTKTSSILDSSGNLIVTKQPKPATTSISELFYARKSLNSELNRPGISDTSKRILVQVKDSIDEALENISKTNPNANNLKLANSIYASREQAKPEGLLKSADKYLPNSESESASKGLGVLQSYAKQNRIEELTKLKNVVGDGAWQPFAERFKQDLVRGIDGNYDIFNGTAGKPETFKFIQKLSKYDDKTLSLFMRPDEIKFYRGLSKVVPWMEDAIQANKLIKPSLGSIFGGPGAIGAGIVGGKAVGLGIGGAAGVGLASGGAYFLSMKVIDRMFNNPNTVKKLIRMGHFTAGQKAGKQFMVQIVKSILEGNPDKKVME